MKKNIRKVYPLEFKESSAKLAFSSECPLSETAQSLGVHVTTLRDWVNKFYPKNKEKVSTTTSVNEEVKQLRLENARLKQERDILKKAAAYFANEMQPSTPG